MINHTSCCVKAGSESNSKLSNHFMCHRIFEDVVNRKTGGLTARRFCTATNLQSCITCHFINHHKIYHVAGYTEVEVPKVGCRPPMGRTFIAGRCSKTKKLKF